MPRLAGHIAGLGDSFWDLIPFPDVDPDIGPVETPTEPDFTSALLDWEGSKEAEVLINRFAEMVGYSQVPVDEDVGLEDARRALDAYRYLLDNFMEDRAQAESLKSQIQAGIETDGLGRWFYNNGSAVIDKLKLGAQKIESGEWKRKPDAGMNFDLKTAAIVGALVVGAAWLATD